MVTTLLNDVQSSVSKLSRMKHRGMLSSLLVLIDFVIPASGRTGLSPGYELRATSFKDPHISFKPITLGRYNSTRK
jgi:hypothetical protein